MLEDGHRLVIVSVNKEENVVRSLTGLHFFALVISSQFVDILNHLPS